MDRRNFLKISMAAPVVRLMPKATAEKVPEPEELTTKNLQQWIKDNESSFMDLSDTIEIPVGLDYDEDPEIKRLLSLQTSHTNSGGYVRKTGWAKLRQSFFAHHKKEVTFIFDIPFPHKPGGVDILPKPDTFVMNKGGCTAYYDNIEERFKVVQWMAWGN